jgi:hypothetical protein
MAAKTATGGAREIVTFVWPIAGHVEPVPVLLVKTLYRDEAVDARLHRLDVHGISKGDKAT